MSIPVPTHGAKIAARFPGACRTLMPRLNRTGLLRVITLAAIAIISVLAIQRLAQVNLHVTPPEAPAPYLPRAVPAIIQARDIQLATSSNVIPQATASFLADAITARLYASFYQDVSYLFPYYSGEALQSLQQNLLSITASGYIQYHEIDASRSYYAGMTSSADGTLLQVDACEYWQVHYYDPNTEVQTLADGGWQLVPQTLTLETVNGAPKITSLRSYEGTAFCTSRISPDGK